MFYLFLPALRKWRWCPLSMIEACQRWLFVAISSTTILSWHCFSSSWQNESIRVKVIILEWIAIPKATVKMCVVLTESGRKKHSLTKLVLAGVISCAWGRDANWYQRDWACFAVVWAEYVEGQEVCDPNTNLHGKNSMVFPQTGCG